MKETVACKFNLEMCLAESIVRIAEKVRPDQVTLVPENRAELTTEGGLECVKNKSRLTAITKRMHKKGILVSTFILPDEKQILATAEAGCPTNTVSTNEGRACNYKNPRQNAVWGEIHRS